VEWGFQLLTELEISANFFRKLKLHWWAALNVMKEWG
jgi:hypothetical protein